MRCLRPVPWACPSPAVHRRDAARRRQPLRRRRDGRDLHRCARERSAGIMLEYYRNPEKTAAAVHDGWYHTGDTAWVDEDGYFWYVGRNDDVIKSSGYRIGPFEIESVLLRARGSARVRRHRRARSRCAARRSRPPWCSRKASRATRRSRASCSNGSSSARRPTNTHASWSSSTRCPKTVNGKIRRAAIREADESQEGKPKTKVPEGLV